MQYEEVTRQLLQVLRKDEDSLRIYRLTEPKEKYIRVYGIDTAIDFNEPLVL
jgi:CRISPR-associated protein Cas2